MDKEEPLMKGLVGQPRPKSNKAKDKGKDKSKIDVDSNTKGAYKLSNINYDVNMRKDEVANGDMKGHIIREDDMRWLGFVEYNFHWELKVKVSPIDTMEEYLIVRIGKAKEGLNIEVVDEFLGEIYDYQAQLYDDEFHPYANRLHQNVQKVMMELVAYGVITNYKENDYI